MDKIKIQNLEVFARHGLYKEENALGQKFLISAVLYTDIRNAGQSDLMEDSINYSSTCHFITDFMKGYTFRLIESAAQRLAEAMLLEIPRLKAVDLEIKKPWAPIGLPIETVSVEISRGWHEAYLSLGSNLGDKKGYLDGAGAALGKAEKIRNIKVSSYYKTAPYGNTDQDEFLNACARVDTILSPHELLDVLHDIENSAARERTVRWGPRTLDLDIILYDDLIMFDDDLIIPHPDMHNRAFVLEPLCEICPGKVHPVFLKTVYQLKDELRERSESGGAILL